MFQEVAFALTVNFGTYMVLGGTFGELWCVPFVSTLAVFGKHFSICVGTLALAHTCAFTGWTPNAIVFGGMGTDMISVRALKLVEQILRSSDPDEQDYSQPWRPPKSCRVKLLTRCAHIASKALFCVRRSSEKLSKHDEAIRGVLGES